MTGLVGRKNYKQTKMVASTQKFCLGVLFYAFYVTFSFCSGSIVLRTHLPFYLGLAKFCFVAFGSPCAVPVPVLHVKLKLKSYTICLWYGKFCRVVGRWTKIDENNTLLPSVLLHPL